MARRSARQSAAPATTRLNNNNINKTRVSSPRAPAGTRHKKTDVSPKQRNTTTQRRCDKKPASTDMSPAIRKVTTNTTDQENVRPRTGFSKKKQNRITHKENLNSSVCLNNSSYRRAMAEPLSPVSAQSSTPSADHYIFEEKDSSLQIRLDLLSPIKPILQSCRRSSKRKSSASVKSLTSASLNNSSSLEQLRKKPKFDYLRDLSQTRKSTPKRQKHKTPSFPPASKKTPALPQSDHKVSQSLSYSNYHSTPAMGCHPVDSGVFVSPTLVAKDTTSNNFPSSLPTKEVPKAKCSKKFRKMPKAKAETCLPNSPKLSPVHHLCSPDVELQGDLVTSQSELLYGEDFAFAEAAPVPAAPVALYEEVRRESLMLGQDALEDSEDELNASYKTMDISKTYADVGYGSIIVSMKKKKLSKKGKSEMKKKNQRGKLSVSRYEQLADRMNREFDDLEENFELSLE